MSATSTKIKKTCDQDIRPLCLKLLRSYEEEGRYVNLLLSSPEVKALCASSQSRLTALLYTTVERKLTYDFFICKFSGRSMDKISPKVRDILRLGMCQLMHMESIPGFAAVNETVALGANPGERSFINGVLRSAERALDDLPYPDPERSFHRYLSVYYSVPQPLVKHFISLYGKEGCHKLLSAFASPGRLSLSVNTEKTSVADLLEKLGDRAKRAKYTDFGIELEESVSPTSLPGFDEGHFYVQDEASRLSVAALGASPGMTVVDVCAAPGGKSLGAAIAVGPEGRVYSFDIHESKLPLIEKGALRLGLRERIHISVNDATSARADLIGKADRVICDAPCSGLGVIAKKPDLKYKDLSVLAALPELQYSILRESSGYLKPGGIIVYSTCTLIPEKTRG
jgi:16S rRNA (cytosine967-C5)-methyltransferase